MSRDFTQVEMGATGRTHRCTRPRVARSGNALVSIIQSIDIKNHHFSDCVQRREGRARSVCVPKRLSRTESRDGDDTDAVGTPVAEAASCHHYERSRLAMSLAIDLAGHPQ